MGQLQVRLLGTPSVRRDGQALSFPTRKALGLLAYLVVEGGSHPRERLAALFWPDSDARRSRAMLRYTITVLRQTLADPGGAAPLRATRDTLSFDADTEPPAEVDLQVIEAARAALRSRPAAGTSPFGMTDALRQAVARCTGELLADFSLPDAPAFDEWASLQRESWRLKVRPVFERLAEADEATAQIDAARETVRRWLAMDGLHEDAHRRLMRLHLAAGDRAGAMRAYEACRATLQRELDVAPSPETEALADRIRRTAAPQPAAVRGGGTASRRPPLHGVAGVPPSDLLDAPLVGRADELRRLVACFHAAGTGSPQVAVLVGEPGIGKTRLASEVMVWATAQGADVLAGRAFEAGGRLPYQPLVDALRPRLERENAPEDLLSDIWLTELGRLLPELRDRYPDLPVPAGDEAAARSRLFEAITRLVQALAARAPTVLFLDDLQWADEGSLDVLAYAARRWSAARSPILLVLSIRAEGLAGLPALAEWLVGLRRAVAVTRIEPGPLPFEETARFVASLIGETAPTDANGAPLRVLAQWLFAETGGQPLFLVETIRALLERRVLVPVARADGSRGIELDADGLDVARRGGLVAPGVLDVIRARLGRLGQPARDLLAAGAVLGQGFTFEQACRVGALRESDALTAADEVMLAQLLREAVAPDRRTSASVYLFAHDKIREVVYGEAGDARRRVFHRRALEALQATAPAARLAQHALAAGLDEAALQHALVAGDDALRLLAGRDAVAHYTAAIEIAGRLGQQASLAEGYARRGKAYGSLARWADARRDLEAALAGLPADQATAQPGRRAEILADLLEPCWWLLDMPGLRTAANEVLAVTGGLGRGDLETAAIGWLAAAIGADGDVAGCVAQCRRALARADEAAIPAPPQVHTYISLSFYWLGEIQEAVERSRQGVLAARDGNHTSAMMWCLPHLGISLAARGQYTDALEAFAEARRYGREYGVTTLLARAIAMSAGFHLDLEDFDGHEALALEARELAQSLSFPPPAVSAGIDLLLNYARRRDVGKAEAIVDGVAGTVAATSGFHGWLWSLRLAEARAELALAADDDESALTWADQAIRQSIARRRVKYQVIGLGTRARALLGLGRSREAITDLEDAVTLARQVGDPALVLRAAGALLAVDGNDTLAAEVATRAREIADALPEPALRQRFLAGALARAAPGPL
jgi:DNA-binding SARP family transcriptional activator